MSNFNCKVKNVISGMPVEVTRVIGVDYYLINNIHKYKVPITRKQFYDYKTQYNKWINT
jgi:hypothetical protein